VCLPSSFSWSGFLQAATPLGCEGGRIPKSYKTDIYDILYEKVLRTNYFFTNMSIKKVLRNLEKITIMGYN